MAILKRKKKCKYTHKSIASFFLRSMNFSVAENVLKAAFQCHNTMMLLSLLLAKV